MNIYLNYKVIVKYKSVCYSYKLQLLTYMSIIHTHERYRVKLNYNALHTNIHSNCSKQNTVAEEIKLYSPLTIIILI